MKNNLNDRIKGLLSGKNSMKVILIIGFVGVACIVGSEYIHFNPAPLKATTTVDDYEMKLETQIAGVISAITGESSPEIMITLESTPRYVYATENKKKNKEMGDGGGETNSEETYIIVKKSDGTQEALLVTEIHPEINGIVIVSKYAGNAVIRENMINAVRTVLNLSSN
ncbi:MAG: hypothetical protein RSC76_00950, partial [Oscillospiraceae bacterium]